MLDSSRIIGRILNSGNFQQKPDYDTHLALQFAMKKIHIQTPTKLIIRDMFIRFTHLSFYEDMAKKIAV